MAENMGLVQGKQESDHSFLHRFLVTFTGAWIPSLVHAGIPSQQWADLIAGKLHAFLPDVPVPDPEPLFRILRENGCILQTKKGWASAPPASFTCGELMLERNGTGELYSGLCAFSEKVSEKDESAASWELAFDLPDPRTDFLALLFERSVPVRSPVFAMEYLNLTSGGIWMFDEKRPSWHDYLLGSARDITGSYTYYIISGPEVRQVPDFLTDKDLHSYARLQIMRRYPPVIRVRHDGPVTLYPETELPCAEIRFLKLISWPLPGTGACSLHPRVWAELRRRWEKFGFRISESK